MTQLKLVTYNVKMLPPLAKLGTDTSYEKSETDDHRMTRIVNLVTSLQPKPDIIAFQEVFDNDQQQRCRTLLSKLGYASTEKIDDNDLFHEDSGLLLAVNQATLTWNKRYFYVEYNDHAGADAWSDKGLVGLLLSCVQDPSARLCFFATHSQADAEHADVRLKQFEQARRHIRRVVGGQNAAVILAGDMNVIGDTTEFQRMIQTLRYPRDLYRKAYPDVCSDPGYTWDGPANSMTPGTAQERLDYILAFDFLPIDDARSLGRRLRRVDCTGIKVEKFDDASDHYGLSATIAI